MSGSFTGTLTGTGTLLRFHLRRDRWLVLWWSVGIALLYWSQAVGIDGLYATQAELDAAAQSMETNTAMIAMAGPARALNTVGGQVTWQASAFGALAAGLMSMFVVGRHTRAEEESGRDELVRAAPVGRLAPVVAALLTALVANLAVGAAVTTSLVAYPLAVADSLALGVGVALCGLTFTGTALVAVQLVGSTRAAYAIAGSVLGAAYALRAVGDAGESWIRWLSPIAWYQSMHPFSGLRWWPALLLLGAALLGLGAAAALLARRDVGSGLLAARPGPAEAGRGLRGPVGLVWRLQRPAVLGWGLGLFLVGLAYGTIGKDVEELLGDSEFSRELMLAGGADPVDGFYATALLMLALIACGFAISSSLRPRADEETGRAELLLATALPRRSWWSAHVLVAVGGALAVLAAAGLGTGVGYAAVTGEWGAVVRYVLPALSYAVGVLLIAALAQLVVGLAPRLTVLAWLPLLVAVVVMLFGDTLDLPQVVQGLSPFEHLASVPVEDVAWAPLVVVGLVALGVSSAGQWALRRRDIG